MALLYYALLKSSRRSLVTPFLFAASLVYYAWWRPQNLWVILASITFNYLLGKAIAHSETRRKPLFILGLTVNLGALGWYKYTDFALSTINALLHSDFPMREIILPIGISFFTFQQIAYLLDIYTRKHDPLHEGFMDYCCFVCFFPQLVAGPIVHHQEMMPQFHDSRNHRVNWENIFNGLVLFSIGLAKKILIADQLSPVVGQCFDTSAPLSFLEASFGSICYTLQLYFDFSAYSDMAIGGALFFNIHLPQNFNSPYKSASIQEFWRRWHITLSRWLRDYLYIPLGGNRRGAWRTLSNLGITFLLGGLWHGAAWTFVLWGALHGAALAVHRLWHKAGLKLPTLLGWLATFAFVNLAWVVFRAPSMERLKAFAKGFLGGNGFMLRREFRESVINASQLSSFSCIAVFVLCCLCLALLFPNSAAILQWSPRKKLWLAVILSVFGLLFMLLPLSHPEFIYSKF